MNNLGLVTTIGNALFLRSGQPTRADFEMLRTLTKGWAPIRHSYQLNTDKPPNDVPEGILLHRIPLGGWMNMFPSVEELCVTAAQIHGTLLGGDSLLLNCSAGIDRTGVEVATYRIRECGWTIEQAQTEREAYGVTALRDATMDAAIVQTLEAVAALRAA